MTTREWTGYAEVCLLLTAGAVGCTVGDGSGEFPGFGISEGSVTSSATGASESSEGNAAPVGDDDPLETPDLGAADDGGSGCADVTASIQPVIPTIVLVVDRSGSMMDDLGGISRWDAVTDAMFDPADGVVTQLQSSVRFGMALYTSDNGMFGGECPLMTEVNPSLDNLGAMSAAFSAPLVNGDTPTGEALEAVTAALAPDVDSARAIVLATDGEPDTCAVPDPQTGQPESVAAVVNAHASGIKTFILSVGGQITTDHLQELANVGVGKAANDPEPAPFFEALNATELQNAFDEIVGGFVSCEFAIDGIVDLDAACEGTVLLDGAPLECGMGWNVIDESTLELTGDACDILQDGGTHSVEATFPCTAIMIP